MVKPKPSFNVNWQNFRWLTSLTGLSLLIWGQVQIASDTIPEKPATALGIWLNAELHLSIPSIDNVVRGLPLLLVGVFFLFLSLRGQITIPAKKEIVYTKPILSGFLRAGWLWLVVGTVIYIFLLWQLRNRDYQVIMVVQWLLALLVFAIAAALWDHHRQIGLSPGVGRIDALWLLGLLILGLIVGAFRLQGLPDMLIGDEGAFYSAARDIARGEFSPPIFASGVYTFPVLSSIGQALIMKVFGTTLWGWRLSSVISGTLAVLPVYLLGRDLFNRKIAIASSLALIFSPYFLAFSRLGYNNIQSLFITALALYWLYIAIHRSSIFYMFLSGCAAGLGFYTYFAARMAIVIAIAFIGFLWLGRKLKFRYAAFYIGILTIGVTLVIGPYIVYGIHNDAQGMSFKVFESVFFNTFNGLQFYSQDQLTALKPIFTIGGNDLFYNPRIYLELLTRGLIRTLLIFQKPWLISEHFIASPLTGTLGVIFYLIGLGMVFKRLKESRHLLLALWFLVTIFGLSVLNTVPPRHTHMVSIIPMLALVTGVGLFVLTELIGSFWKKLYKLKSLILGTLTLIVAIGGIYDYFFLMPSRYHPNADQVISWAGMYAKQESFLFVYTNQGETDLVRPYLITQFYPEVEYNTVSIEEFQQKSDVFTGEQKVLVFYLPTLAEAIEPILFQDWGQQTILRDFYNPDGIPVISAGMNTPFVFERDRNFFEIFRESYGRESLLATFAVLFLLFGMTAFIPQSWKLRLPRWVQTFSAWFNAPTLPSEPQEEEFFPGLEQEQEAALAIEEQPSEPPIWADEVFPDVVQEKSGKPIVESKSVRSSRGRDLYLHVRLPPIRFPSRQISDNLRVSLPELHIPMPVLLFLVIVLSILAQVLISQQEFLSGAILYGLGAIGLIVWARKNPKWMNVLPKQVRIPPKVELWIGLLLLVVVIFTRFYDLGYRVYGLEADETKWTAQSWLSSILKVDAGEFASMHYQYLPVDFWVRSIFLRLFGLDFLSAHIESAVFSVVASVFLFLLIRRLTANPPIALLGTALYAFSFIELNGSHQALHNTTLEPWMMAALYFLVAGLQDKKWWQFQIAGILFALGMLTYETFFPTVGVALVFPFGMAIAQITRKQANLKQWLQDLSLLVWPILLTYLVFTQPYLASRHDYHFGWLDTYSEKGSNLTGAAMFVIQNVGILLKTTFSGVVFPDSLLRWQGSFLNPLILPFIVIGFIHNICNLRKPFSVFIPLWYVFNVAFAPIALGSVWPRVLYTSVAPLMIWGAIGLWIFLAALRQWLHGLKINIAVPIFLCLILVIFANDYRIFTNGIDDPLDRLKRRELADMTTEVAEDAAFLVFPYMPAENDSFELETHVLLFTIASAHKTGLEALNDFTQIPYDQLLTFLWQNRQGLDLVIFHDKSNFTLTEERSRFLDLLLICYPDTKLQLSGVYFDVYRLANETLAHPVCYQASAPSAVYPTEGMQISENQDIVFEWDSSGINTTGYIFSLEQNSPGTYWVEAEDQFQTNGWYASSEFTTGFTGSGFLLDNWESDEAQYALNIENQGQYRLWVRSYKRQYNDQQNFITLNDQLFFFSGNDSPLDQWNWESIEIFDLPAGETDIGLGRLYGKDEMFSVFIDAILITSDLESPPGETSVWKMVYSIDDIDNPRSQFTLIDSLPPGKFRWSVRVFDGDRLLDSDGQLGIAMPFSSFTILP